VQVAVFLREMVHPTPHEVFGEKHREIGAVYTTQCFLEDKESPELPLRRR